jgi:hypothetical protein
MTNFHFSGNAGFKYSFEYRFSVADSFEDDVP